MAEEEEGAETKIEAGVLKNVGVLNLKDVPEEGIIGLRAIKNTGILIVPKNLMGRLADIKLENVGVFVPYVEGMRIYAGETLMNADMLKSLEEPISILQAGKLQISGDVTPELIMQKVKEIRNYGKITVPTKEIYGALMAKVTENMGKITIEE
ncbi:MAG: hypothetical protein AYL32_005480 [Candidatus Bathyarchaeota archaeon B26-2]|nr:MAG: hypothetical protein AYL32_005480 [Candidatus Bathyarchaeota archaeon B26-2]